MGWICGIANYTIFNGLRQLRHVYQKGKIRVINDKNLTAEEFKSLYTPDDLDESITVFTDEAGFSIIRKYEPGTIYSKDDLRMFIRLAVKADNRIYSSVDATKLSSDFGPDHYSIIDTDKYKWKITNFFSNGEDFEFDHTTNEIKHISTAKSFTVNEFVKILIKNHLSDRLFFKRQLNKLADLLLIIIFWVIDKHYDRVRIIIDRLHARDGQRPRTQIEDTNEPFFKYFKVSRNLILVLSIILFIFASFLWIPSFNHIARKFWIIGDFSISNPVILIYSFCLLIVAEKISRWLNAQYDSFFQDDREDKKFNVIKRLNNFQYKNQFELKLRL